MIGLDVCKGPMTVDNLYDFTVSLKEKLNDKKLNKINYSINLSGVNTGDQTIKTLSQDFSNMEIYELIILIHRFILRDILKSNYNVPSKHDLMLLKRVTERQDMYDDDNCCAEIVDNL